MKEEILDLRTCNDGMSCEEYSLLVIAGPNDIPSSVRARMDQHQRACEYHQGKAFHQSALNTPVTEELKRAAQEVVEKYNQ